MGLKVITIDFWNTLFDASNGKLRNAFRQKALITEIDKLGVIIKQEQFTEAMKASWEFFNNIWINEQRTPMPSETVGFFWDFLKLKNNSEAQNKIVNDFAESIIKYPPKPIEGAREALEQLSGKYKLAIVSDTGFSPGSVLLRLMKLNDMDGFFSAFSFSDETGYAKPHKIAFQKVLDELDCPPDLALHVGDIERTDIAGAKEMGMKAVRFTGDETVMPVENETETIADATADTWEEIVNRILFIDSQ